MSLKSHLQRYIPERKHIQEHKHLRHFGDWLHDPNIWHLTRRSSAGGVAIGLFWAMMPIPLQTVFAATTAIILRLNLPLSIIFVWATNPITAAPVYYLAYKLGSILLDEPIQNVAFEFSIHWMANTLVHICNLSWPVVYYWAYSVPQSAMSPFGCYGEYYYYGLFIKVFLRGECIRCWN